MEDSSKRVCGARNRQGQPCQKPPLKGKERCMMHGGKTPTKTRGNGVHGLYSAALTDAEAAAGVIAESVQNRTLSGAPGRSGG